MQQPPRLHGSGAGQRSGAAPASVPVAPSTPRKAQELDNLIRSLEDQYQLGFNVKRGHRSPAQLKRTADRAARQIGNLFYNHRPVLDDALATFATTATFIAKDQRANPLLTVLQTKSPHVSPMSRSGTTMSAKNGNQPLIKPPVSASSKPAPTLFKKPSLQMARSFDVFPASQSTVNTTFNTVSSSQQTQPDTANTSFTSDTNPTEVPHTFFTRNSSTIMGSLDDQDLNVGAKVSNEALAMKGRQEPSNTPSQGRDSSSTWGSSLSEEDLLEASARVESVYAMSSFAPGQLSPQRLAHQVGGSQPTLSLTKNGAFAQAKSAIAALAQSFPPPPGVSAKLSPDKAASKPKSPANGVTPRRAQRQSPREQTPVESPSKIAYHIRDIPGQGLFVGEPESSLRVMPYFALFICQRIALEHSVTLAELVCNMDLASACADPVVFWASLLEHPKILRIKFKDSERLWSAAKRSYDGFTFKGQVNLRSKNSGPIFQLDLHPVLPDKSCRFQRGTIDDLKHIRNHCEKWLHTEHTFLYPKWRVFHIAPMKKEKKKSRTTEVTHKFRIVLFATEGCGIDQKHTVGGMLNWFLPFSENVEQSFYKAFARFDLGLSRTTPTHIFNPTQIIRVGDTIANGDREATEFDDPGLKSFMTKCLMTKS
ncbi:uncharacterized protein M421DRAFT_10521 [Didymella exigua CBS 183.55]|uniref:RNA-dependent RNA polymerase n=1 Tax=Didymella exigua CBS 183.55 TaxID=1150837 RepID=A0A6A5R5K9_9PLEO|nr:uncharacterized protein M421DRAFT_10521 [Didymella exigua CBS 183.55]KAF1922470.1 hypothetical protein M421DRAFT_10521 [Didymella exigua CBS 183.55]